MGDAEIGPDEDSLNRKFEKWDRGELTYPRVGDGILNTKPGESFNEETITLLKECTRCPVGNASCISAMKIVLYGFHPRKPGEEKVIRLCPHGCDEKTCLLNK
jgi:hypothetical protein